MLVTIRKNNILENGYEKYSHVLEIENLIVGIAITKDTLEKLINKFPDKVFLFGSILLYGEYKEQYTWQEIIEEISIDSHKAFTSEFPDNLREIISSFPENNEITQNINEGA